MGKGAVAAGIGVTAGLAVAGYVAYRKGWLDFLLGNGDENSVCPSGSYWNGTACIGGTRPSTFSWLIPVKGAESRPLAGATVTITCRGNIPGECTDCPCMEGAYYSKVTDSAGAAQFTGIPTGWYDLKIEAAGYETHESYAYNRSDKSSFVSSAFLLYEETISDENYYKEEFSKTVLSGVSVLDVPLSKTMTPSSGLAYVTLVNNDPGGMDACNVIVKAYIVSGTTEYYLGEFTSEHESAGPWQIIMAGGYGSGATLRFKRSKMQTLCTDSVYIKAVEGYVEEFKL